MSIDIVQRPGEAYDRSFGDARLCACGHTYYRHFDWSEDYFPTCKYCPCMEWVEPDGLLAKLPAGPVKDLAIDAVAKIKDTLTSAGTASLPGSGYNGTDKEYVLVPKWQWERLQESLDALLHRPPETEEPEHVCGRDDPLDECPDCGLDAQ